MNNKKNFKGKKREISKKRYLDPKKNKIKRKNPDKSDKKTIQKKIRDLKRLIEHTKQKGVRN